MNAANAPPAGAAPPPVHYTLQLYVAGNSPLSTRAVERARRLLETRLAGRYSLSVIDLYQQPELAAREQIVALPALVRVAPEPALRLIGDLADPRRVCDALGLDDTAGP